jgi:hypothetical protein
MIKRTKEQISTQIKKVMEDYLREPSKRTLGYLQLLLNHYDMFSKPIDYFDKPINDLPITEMGQGRTDALEWLHNKSTV